MPVIEVSKKGFFKLYGKSVNEKELDNLLMKVKGELEHLDNEIIKIELNDTNRPDTWSSEGIVRCLKTKSFDFKKKKKKPSKVLKVKEMKNVRGYVAGFIAHNVKMDDGLIKELIQSQEKIFENFGGKRKRVAGGVYNNKKLEWPITLKPGNPDTEKIIPLGYSNEMSLNQVLKKHSKGKEYGHIINKYSNYPIYKDSKNVVFSMPPITNDNISGRVTVNDSELFVELNGTNFNQVLLSCNIFSQNFEDRGAVIEPIIIEYDYKTSLGRRVITPYDFNNELEISKEDVNNLLGTNLSELEIINHLKNMQYLVKKVKKNIVVKIPFYRNDIISNVDLIEDVMISLGYNNVKTVPINLFTLGGRSDLMKKVHLIRDLVSRMGFLEINNPSLTNKSELFERTNRPEIELIEVDNVISSNYSVLKHELLPALINFESKNTHNEYPHLVFEINDSVNIDETKPNLSKETKHLAILKASKETDFNDIKSILITLFKELDFDDFNLIETNDSLFSKGRRANILIKDKKVGVFGEINPEVIIKNGITIPLTGLELNISELNL